MVLLERPSNIQDDEVTGRKRSHGEFAGSGTEIKESVNTDNGATDVQNRPPNSPACYDMSSPLSSPGASPVLTEADLSEPISNSPGPRTPGKPMSLQAWATSAKSASSDKLRVSTQIAAQSENPAKRKKTSAADKEAQEREKQAKLTEKAAQKAKLEEQKAAEKAQKARLEEQKAAEKAAEKAKLEEQKAAEKAAEKAEKEERKAALVKEKEEKRKEKEEERRMKAEERDEKKRKKEEEQSRVQEEKEKKERSQLRLGAFFGQPKPQKKPVTDSEESIAEERVAGSPTKTEKTPYERKFQPFFVKENTTWTKSAIQMDEETKKAKSRILDDSICGQQAQGCSDNSFNPIKLLGLPPKLARRGCLHEPVKHILEKMYQDIEANEHGSTDEVARIYADAKGKLARIPTKIIAFSRDVRPPYYGTISQKQFALGRDGMARLARRSTKRRLPLDYEYDSEAEWQEEEEGEDLDADDDEEELDDEDDMDGFLDDSEDVSVQRRLFASNLEVENTGICYENRDQTKGGNTITRSHKLEIMHESLPQSWGIDPFSTQYWEPEPSKKQKQKQTQQQQSKKPPPGAEKAAEAKKMAPPPAPTPTNAFAALATGSSSTGASGGMSDKMVKAEILNELKQIIMENKDMSKAGVIEVVFSRLRSQASRAEVKNTVEHVAERVGSGRQKAWELKKGHEISV